MTFDGGVMIPRNFTEQWTRGDDERLDYVVRLDGVVQDLSGWELWCTIKRDLALADDAAGVLQYTIGDGITVSDWVVDGSLRTGALLSVSIPHADTVSLTVGQRYQYDVQGRSPAGLIYTLIRGEVSVLPEVTQAVAYP
jgi:hypothetical protein